MSSTLYVGNLTPEVGANDVRKLLSKYGRVVSVELKGGYAFVDMGSRRECDTAIYRLDGVKFFGSTLRVEFAHGDYRRRYAPPPPVPATAAPVDSRDICFKCGGVGHFARDCPSGRVDTSTRRRVVEIRNDVGALAPPLPAGPAASVPPTGPRSAGDSYRPGGHARSAPPLPSPPPPPPASRYRDEYDALPAGPAASSYGNRYAYARPVSSRDDYPTRDYGRDRVPTGPAALTDPLLRCDADYRRREVLPDRPRDARPYDARRRSPPPPPRRPLTPESRPVREPVVRRPPSPRPSVRYHDRRSPLPPPPTSPRGYPPRRRPSRSPVRRPRRGPRTPSPRR